jgi:beta-phosphoglucomutase
MFKGAIFDLDGVIVNTVPFHFKAWKKMFSEYGIDFNFNEYKHKIDGIPRFDGAKAILTDLSKSEIEKAGDIKQKYFLELVEKEKVPVYGSTVVLTKKLKEHNKKIAFASSSRNCKRILEKTGLMYLADTIVDGSDITRGKPDPQIFELAAQGLGCDYSECVVFEDAVLGVEAAINANMKCVGIDRYDNASRLAKADLVVKDLKETDYEAIEGLFGK